MVLGCVSPPIRQALSSNTLQGHIGAHIVGIAQLNAVVHAEIELCQIALQMLLAAMLVSANHAALEHRKEAFQRVRVDAIADVFLGMVNALMGHASELVDLSA